MARKGQGQPKQPNRPTTSPHHAGAQDLLNFRLPERPKQDHRSKSRAKQKRPEEDRATAQRKAGLFPLHASPDHRFLISRKNYGVSGDTKPDSYQGPDSPVAWSTVKIVHHLSSTELSCPICLDTDMQCPRITKCGHSFCFTCLIHHVQSSQHTDTVKCPCCSLPIFLQDLRPVEITIVESTTFRFVKLHRQRQSSVPYIPRPDRPRRRGHGLPSVQDPDATFARFNYFDPVAHQTLLHTELQQLVNESSNGKSTTMEELCRSSALQMIQQDLARAEMELPWEMAARNEQKRLEHPRFLMAVQPSEEPSHPDATTARRSRVDSIASATSCGSGRSGQSAVKGDGGSMYADEEDEFTMYQAENGTLCFLSGFNMSCLRAEYSCGPPALCRDMASLDLNGPVLAPPGSNDEEPSRRKPPLPDFVEGKVMEMEHVHLTADIRQRRRFLAHLPLYTDLCFIELNLGNYLGSKTKHEFRKEFQKRKQKRTQKANAEKRADKKLEQQERERIEGLRAVFQHIDPSDDFFQYPRAAEPEPEPAAFTSEDFGPAAASANSSRVASSVEPAATVRGPTPSISFSQVCRAGEDFPSLESAPTESNFPALGTAAQSVTRPGWGPNVKKSQPNATTTLTPLTHSKKGKSKKVVLFSTGAQRGDYL